MDPSVFSAGGLTGLIVAGLYSLLKGLLVPGRTVDRLTDQWEARLAESHRREQLWQLAYERSEDRANVQAQQLGELMALARTTDALLRALPLPRGGAEHAPDRS
jgi:hypothetical protein